MYNPMMNILFQILGQAAVQGMAGQTAAQQQNPDDDTPIDVEAQVVDDDGRSAAERTYERAERQRVQQAEHQLAGEVSYFGSKGYVLATGVITALLAVCGIVLRIYTLVMGNIFSQTIVPVVLGILAALVMMLAASLLMWRRGKEGVPFCEVDLVMVFFSALLMGWGNLLPAVGAALLGAAYMAARKGKRMPFYAPFLVIAALQFALLGFPGLVSLF